MIDVPRRTLVEMVARLGADVCCDEPKRCKGYLRDRCGSYVREINVLIAAVEERVAADLRGAPAAVPKELLLAKLTKRLVDNRGIADHFARWCVESWQIALGGNAAPPISSRTQNNVSPCPNSDHDPSPLRRGEEPMWAQLVSSGEDQPNAQSHEASNTAKNSSDEYDSSGFHAPPQNVPNIGMLEPSVIFLSAGAKGVGVSTVTDVNMTPEEHNSQAEFHISQQAIAAGNGDSNVAEAHKEAALHHIAGAVVKEAKQDGLSIVEAVRSREYSPGEARLLRIHIDYHEGELRKAVSAPACGLETDQEPQPMTIQQPGPPPIPRQQAEPRSPPVQRESSWLERTARRVMQAFVGKPPIPTTPAQRKANHNAALEAKHRALLEPHKFEASLKGDNWGNPHRIETQRLLDEYHAQPNATNRRRAEKKLAEAEQFHKERTLHALTQLAQHAVTKAQAAKDLLDQDPNSVTGLELKEQALDLIEHIHRQTDHSEGILQKHRDMLSNPPPKPENLPKQQVAPKEVEPTGDPLEEVGTYIDALKNEETIDGLATEAAKREARQVFRGFHGAEKHAYKILIPEQRQKVIAELKKRAGDNLKAAREHHETASTPTDHPIWDEISKHEQNLEDVDKHREMLANRPTRRRQERSSEDDES